MILAPLLGVVLGHLLNVGLTTVTVAPANVTISSLSKGRRSAAHHCQPQGRPLVVIAVFRRSGGTTHPALLRR